MSIHHHACHNHTIDPFVVQQANAKQLCPSMQVLSIPTATTLRSGSLTAAITPTAEGHNGGSLQPSPSGPASGQNTVTTQYAPAAQPRGAVSVGFPPQDSVPHEHAESEAPAPSAHFSLMVSVFQAKDCSPHQSYTATYDILGCSLQSSCDVSCDALCK